MKLSRYLLVGLAALGLSAQDAKPNPLYLGFTYVLNQADLMKYAGGNPSSYAFEGGYTVIPVDEGIGFGVYGRYMRTFGDRRTGPGFPTGGVKLALDTWTAGADFTFATPWAKFVPYAGLNLNFFDGSKSDAFLAPKYSFEDSKAKFGARLGFQYRFSPKFVGTMDYNFAEWRSASRENRLPGVNPMNPSWVGVGLRYQFDM